MKLQKVQQRMPQFYSKNDQDRQQSDPKNNAPQGGAKQPRPNQSQPTGQPRPAGPQPGSRPQPNQASGPRPNQGQARPNQPRPAGPRPVQANGAGSNAGAHGGSNGPRPNQAPSRRPQGGRPSSRRFTPPTGPVTSRMEAQAMKPQAGPFNFDAPYLKVLPLGGNGTVTQNMFVYEYGEDIVVVDCGMGFPEADLLGIDIVLPDITYLKDKLHRIKALVITHGHEDHIGAIPYLAPKLNVPIYAPRFALELIKHKLTEFNSKQDLHEVELNKSYTFGPFTFTPYRENHSIPDTFGYIIDTPVGKTIHTGDYKYDWTSADGTIIEVDKMARAGGEGVLCLMSDCLRIEKPGFTLSESVVEDRLDTEIRKAKGRVFLTTISSNVTRMQQVINVAMRYNRKVAFAGRSVENVAGIATRLGYFHVPEGVMVKDTAISDLPDDQQIIILTGAMGQEGSALARLTSGDHKLFALKEGDLVIFSADPIPGSEDRVFSLIDDLTERGASVAYSDIVNNLHVSGHAASEELKLSIALTKPKFLLPISGMARQLKAYSEMAQAMGYPPQNIFVVEAGQEVLFDNQGHARLGETHPYVGVLVDGLGVGDVGEVVIADRKQLSDSGVFIVAATLNKQRELVGEIELQTRGFIYARNNDKLMNEAKSIARTVLTDEQTKTQDFTTIRSRLADRLGKHFKTSTDRTPIILPLIMEV